jgi:hypothetical protein
VVCSGRRSPPTCLLPRHPPLQVGHLEFRGHQQLRCLVQHHCQPSAFPLFSRVRSEASAGRSVGRLACDSRRTAQPALDPPPRSSCAWRCPRLAALGNVALRGGQPSTLFDSSQIAVAVAQTSNTRPSFVRRWVRKGQSDGCSRASGRRCPRLSGVQVAEVHPQRLVRSAHASAPRSGQDVTGRGHRMTASLKSRDRGRLAGCCSERRNRVTKRHHRHAPAACGMWEALQ